MPSPSRNYGRLAAAADWPRALSSGPPDCVGWNAPAAVAADCPRAASFGPPTWLVGVTVELALFESLDESRITDTTAAQITSPVTISIESLLKRTRTGLWVWGMPDILASFWPGRLMPQTIRGTAKGAVMRW